MSSVQTYAKSLYRKLGVHSRQELIDMVNEAANGNDRAR
ncbi:MAG: LuxR C-terminal-related transcriptional regulator [Coriobacteriaceae bacterium]